MEKRYIVTGIDPYTAVHASLRTMINRKGWSCFPFEVIDTGQRDDLGISVCRIPNAPGCEQFTLFYFIYEVV